MFPARLNSKGRCIAFDHAQLFPQRLDLGVQLFDVHVGRRPLAQQLVKLEPKLFSIHPFALANPCQHYTTLR